MTNKTMWLVRTENKTYWLVSFYHCYWFIFNETTGDFNFILNKNTDQERMMPANGASIVVNNVTRANITISNNSVTHTPNFSPSQSGVDKAKVSSPVYKCTIEQSYCFAKYWRACANFRFDKRFFELNSIDTEKIKQSCLQGRHKTRQDNKIMVDIVAKFDDFVRLVPYTYANTHIHTHTHSHIHTHIHTHTHTHARTHTYIHMHMAEYD